MKIYTGIFLVSLGICMTLLFSGCGNGERNGEEDPEFDRSVYDQFFDNMAYHCDEAFPGGLTLEPPGDEMLDGDELLVVHFRECGQDTLRVPFHIEQLDGEWDRSRTWVIFKTEEGLEIRHDHRKPDGSHDDFTWYGGPSHGDPDPNQMEFISHERTAETGQYRGWRLIIEPGERYTYGTFRDGEWSWRVDFDLSNPIQPPPPPWGFED